MKYIITESQFYISISKYISGYFGGLREIDSPQNNIKYFVDENKKVVFYYSTDSGNLYIETPGLKEHIVNLLENVFDLGYFRAMRILEEWFSDNYGINIYKIYQS